MVSYRKKIHFDNHGLIRTIGKLLQCYINWREAEAVGKKPKNEGIAFILDFSEPMWTRYFERLLLYPNYICNWVHKTHYSQKCWQNLERSCDIIYEENLETIFSKPFLYLCLIFKFDLSTYSILASFSSCLNMRTTSLFAAIIIHFVIQLTLLLEDEGNRFFWKDLLVYNAVYYRTKSISTDNLNKDFRETDFYCFNVTLAETLNHDHF